MGDLVTYPLTTTMLSVPGAKAVRGYSLFGYSVVYILFDDKTDPYWARSRVVAYLNQVQSRLPTGTTAALGPDAREFIVDKGLSKPPERNFPADATVLRSPSGSGLTRGVIK